LRLYLISSWRGKKAYLNKPVRGQRTRSNAKSNNIWTKVLKNKIKVLLKTNESRIVDNKNYFIHIKKKTKSRKFVKKEKVSGFKTMLTLKKWY